MLFVKYMNELSLCVLLQDAGMSVCLFLFSPPPFLTSIAWKRNEHNEHRHTLQAFLSSAPKLKFNYRTK